MLDSTFLCDSHWCARRESDIAQGRDLAFQSQVDQSRLISSAAFRRLQGKTQVMEAGEHDFFRTRLTHSLEVAQIGASLVSRLQWLAQKRQSPNSTSPNSPSQRLDQALIPPQSLIETACLAHDIGHPPYGHNSEDVLNYFMLEHGGFEGNGQTFNVLCNLGEYSQAAGYDFCRRTLLAVIKYPVLFSATGLTPPAKPDALPQDVRPWTPPKCLHDDDAETLAWVLAPFSDDDRQTFTSVRKEPSLKPSLYKSFDCSVMELADDIAYGVHDLEDALAMGLLNSHQVAQELKYELAFLAKLRQKPADYYREKLVSNDPRKLKQAITNMVRTFVFQTHTLRLGCFEHPLLDTQMVLPDETNTVLSALKGYLFKHVIDQPSLRTQGYKGKTIIAKLFEALIAQPYDLLPRAVFKLAQEREISQERMVCNYIASMTDQEAAAMYKRLFLPERGSIFQPI